MAKEFELAFFTLKNISNILDQEFGDTSETLSYQAKDSNNNIRTVFVDTWKKIVDNIRTDLVPLSDILERLKLYIKLGRNIDIAHISEGNSNNKVIEFILRDKDGNEVRAIPITKIYQILKSYPKKNDDIYFRAGAPSDDFGNNGNIYIETFVGTIFLKHYDRWVKLTMKNASSTETPKLSGVDNINEDEELDITITNYNQNYEYYIEASAGKATLNKNTGHISYILARAHFDRHVTLRVVADNPGSTASKSAVAHFMVIANEGHHRGISNNNLRHNSGGTNHIF